MTIGSVGIVGYGSFGSLLEKLLQRFAPQITVRVYSSRFEPDGKKFFSMEQVAQCDAVVLTVPISAFEVTLIQVLPLMPMTSVIVDVATVKIYTVEILKRLAADRLYIATHPMFGPESYKKTSGEVTGYRIVISHSTLPKEQSASLIAFLQQCGFLALEIDAETHDKQLAETLFLTHFVGQIVERGIFSRTDIDTVSFGYLMDAVESVKHDTALFQDVFRFNPYCREVLKRFAVAQSEVRALLGESD